MNRLLTANFVRLRRDKVFWLGFVLMAAVGIFVPLSNYITIHRMIVVTGEQVTLELGQVFFGYNVIVPFAAAIFDSLFIGTEYSDGAIRNKLVVGHKRKDIYLANLITCTAVTLVFALMYMFFCGLTGMFTFDGFGIGIQTSALYLLASVCLILAFNALFVCLAMLNQNKAVVAIMTIPSVLLFLFAALYVEGRLNEPEYWDGEFYMTAEGQIVHESAVSNPYYVSSPVMRAFLKFLYDFLPGGMAYQLSNAAAQNPGIMALYALLIASAATGLGVFFFRKKDIK